MNELIEETALTAPKLIPACSNDLNQTSSTEEAIAAHPQAARSESSPPPTPKHLRWFFRIPWFGKADTLPAIRVPVQPVQTAYSSQVPADMQDSSSLPAGARARKSLDFRTAFSRKPNKGIFSWLNTSTSPKKGDDQGLTEISPSEYRQASSTKSEALDVPKGKRLTMFDLSTLRRRETIVKPDHDQESPESA